MSHQQFRNVLFWSPADYGLARGASQAGSYTTGWAWRFTKPVKITGVRFAHTLGANKTFKYRVYNLTTSTLLDSGTSGSLATGAVYTLSTSSPITISDITHEIVVAIWETSGTNFINMTLDNHRESPFTSLPGIIGPTAIITDTCYIAGDANPTSGGAPTHPAIEPVYVVI